MAAVAVTGKPFILAAGADLSAIPRMTDRAQALAIARIGHAVFDRLHTAAVPTFVFVNGLALGGGFELALHAHYRTVSAAAAGLALPECFLGIVPAWGGCYLLPNLIGADRAVKVIIENPLSQNRMLTGPQYAGLGVADVLLDGADFLERSLEWAARVVVGEVVVDRPEPDRGEAWDAAVARGRAVADAKVPGAAPAPVPGARPAGAGEDRRPVRGVRRRGRGARRPGHGPRAAVRALRLRPRAEAGAQARRRPGPGARPSRRPRSASSAPA